MNVITRANRDQVPAPSRTRALGPRDRRLERMLAGWLGQMPGVLHRDGNEAINSHTEKVVKWQQLSHFRHFDTGVLGSGMGVVVSWCPLETFP